jgi:hypothetical protein
MPVANPQNQYLGPYYNSARPGPQIQSDTQSYPYLIKNPLSGDTRIGRTLNSSLSNWARLAKLP